MDDNLRFTMLFDIYGKLLTAKQQDIFNEYFLYNLSLREIAENKKISYQAVRDSIKSSKDLLNDYEEKVGMLKLKTKFSNIKKICESENFDKNKILELLSEDDM